MNLPKWRRKAKFRASVDVWEKRYKHKEIWFENYEHLRQFKDSKVLIVGAGPSTLAYDININDYDHIFSCNNIHLSKKLKDLPLSLHWVGRSVNLNDDFLKYLNAHNPVCVIEDLAPDKDKIRLFKKRYNKCIKALMRFNSGVGTLPKLILIAIFTKCKEIHILGMDGYTSDQVLEQNVNHAFLGSTPLYGPSGTVEFYKYEYDKFWSYVFHYLKPNIKFKNVSEFYEDNNLLNYYSKDKYSEYFE